MFVTAWTIARDGNHAVDLADPNVTYCGAVYIGTSARRRPRLLLEWISCPDCRANLELEQRTGYPPEGPAPAPVLTIAARY